MATLAFRRVISATSSRAMVNMSVSGVRATPMVRFFASRNVPGKTYYTKDHEYIRIDTPTTATIGISNFAQESLGEIVYVDIPSKGNNIEKGKSFGTIESVKSANDVYLPVTALVTDVNEAIISKPEQINQDAENEGWLVKVDFADPAQLDGLMETDTYKKYCDEECAH